MIKGLALLMLAGGSLAAQDSRAGIAVLPFENGGSYGKDKEDFDALRKGIAGTLIFELSRNPAARVAPDIRIRTLGRSGAAAVRRFAARRARVELARSWLHL